MGDGQNDFCPALRQILVFFIASLFCKSVNFRVVDDPDPYVFVWASRKRIRHYFVQIRIRILPLTIKKENLDFYYFLTCLDFLYMKTDVNVHSKLNRQKDFEKKHIFVANLSPRVSNPDPDWIRIQSGRWIRIRIGLQHQPLNPDPEKMNTDPKHCCHPLMKKSGTGARFICQGHGSPDPWIRTPYYNVTEPTKFEKNFIFFYCLRVQAG